MIKETLFASFKIITGPITKSMHNFDNRWLYFKNQIKSEKFIHISWKHKVTLYFRLRNLNIKEIFSCEVLFKLAQLPFWKDKLFLLRLTYIWKKFFIWIFHKIEKISLDILENGLFKFFNALEHQVGNLQS